MFIQQYNVVHWQQGINLEILQIWLFIGEKNESKLVINLTITKKSSLKKGDNSAGDIVHILPADQFIFWLIYWNKLMPWSLFSYHFHQQQLHGLMQKSLDCLTFLHYAVMDFCLSVFLSAGQMASILLPSCWLRFVFGLNSVSLSSFYQGTLGSCVHLEIIC